jgi:hypothetical protein
MYPPEFPQLYPNGQTVRQPSSRVNLRSPWPRLGGKRSEVDSSVDLHGLFVAFDYLAVDTPFLKETLGLGSTVESLPLPGTYASAVSIDRGHNVGRRLRAEVKPLSHEECPLASPTNCFPPTLRPQPFLHQAKYPFESCGFCPNPPTCPRFPPRMSLNRGVWFGSVCFLVDGIPPPISGKRELQ